MCFLKHNRAEEPIYLFFRLDWTAAPIDIASRPKDSSAPSSYNCTSFAEDPSESIEYLHLFLSYHTERTNHDDSTGHQQQ